MIITKINKLINELKADEELQRNNLIDELYWISQELANYTRNEPMNKNIPLLTKRIATLDFQIKVTNNRIETFQQIIRLLLTYE